MSIRSKAELTAWARESRRLWLFLDYDGTLADFAPTPDHVHPNREVFDVLEKLAVNPILRLTVLSGRRLEHVRQLIPVNGILLAGSYGIEIRTPMNESLHRLDFAAIRPMLQEVKPQWARLIEGRSGFFLEDKGWTLAMHARFADDHESDLVLEAARQSANVPSLLEHFRILGGHKFLEIAPRLASKREAVAHLLDAYPFDDANLLYIGDDDKDEEAFPLIHERGGVAVKVLQPSQRARPTEADVCFENPGETVAWLNQLAKETA